MNWRFWEPKYTVASVATRIAHGFGNGTIKLGRSEVELQEFELNEKLVQTEVSLFQLADNARGDCRFALAQLDRLGGNVDEVLAHKPTNIRALMLRAKVSRRRWDLLPVVERNQYLESAIENLSKAIQIDPCNDRAWYIRACYYSILGEKEKALENLSEALRLSETPVDEQEEIFDIQPSS